MRTWLLVLLFGLALSIHITPQHQGRQKDNQFDDPNMGKRELGKWNKALKECKHECMGQARAEIETGDVCEGLPDDACGPSKAMMFSMVNMQCSFVCKESIQAGVDAFAKCSVDKCEGKRDKNCFDAQCEADMKASVQARHSELEEMAKNQDFSSLPLDPPADDEQAHWDKKTAACSKRMSQIFEKQAEDHQCEESDFACQIKTSILASAMQGLAIDACKNTTSQAVEYFETCSRLKCEGHRNEECHKKCRKQIKAFYEMSEQMTVSAAQEIASEGSQEHEDDETLGLESLFGDLEIGADAAGSSSADGETSNLADLFSDIDTGADAPAEGSAGTSADGKATEDSNTDLGAALFNFANSLSGSGNAEAGVSANTDAGASASA